MSLVEDCFSAGRAFGGGVANVLISPRRAERLSALSVVVFGLVGRRRWRVCSRRTPGGARRPDALFDDCTLVGPDNALQAGNPGYSGYTRVALRNCRLISLNFSQPQGKPSTGVILQHHRGQAPPR